MDGMTSTTELTSSPLAGRSRWRKRWTQRLS